MCNCFLTEHKGRLPELSPAALKKLKHLTVVSLAAKNKRIPYKVLQEQLDMGNLRELEVRISDFLGQAYTGVHSFSSHNSCLLGVEWWLHLPESYDSCGIFIIFLLNFWTFVPNFFFYFLPSLIFLYSLTLFAS